MVTKMGFSDTLGNVDLSTNYQKLSSETKQKIEQEVRSIVEEGHGRATKLLTSKRKELEIIANALVDYEVLNLEEMQKVLRGEKLQKLKALPGMPIKIPELVLPPGIGGGGTTPGDGAGAAPVAGSPVDRKGTSGPAGGDGGGVRL